MSPGSRWVYRETAVDGTSQRVVVKVTHQTKLIANGVTARVVRDTATTKGQVIEDTFDWYAQDKRGNVWYLGEDTKEYENGKVVSTHGSWEAGVERRPRRHRHARSPAPGDAVPPGVPGRARPRTRPGC